MVKNRDKIKMMGLKRLSLDSCRKEEFFLDNVKYNCVVIPAIDPNMLMFKITSTVTRNILPLAIPLISVFNSLKGVDLSSNISTLLEDENVQNAISQLSKMNDEEVADLVDIAFMFVSKENNLKSLDVDQLMLENPTHFYLIVFNFLKINVSPFFIATTPTPKKQEEMKIV